LPHLAAPLIRGSPDLSNPSRHQCLSPPAPSPLLDALRAAPVHALRRAMGKPPHTGVVEPRRGALSPHPRHSGPQPHLRVFPFALQVNQRSRERESRGRREEGERKRGSGAPPRRRPGTSGREPRRCREEPRAPLPRRAAPLERTLSTPTTAGCTTTTPLLCTKSPRPQPLPASP
jgi:hypothetical protein